MSKFDIDFDPKTLPNGLYIIYWKDVEGSSFASVGRDESGNVWMAPCNWIGGMPTFDWSSVSSVERVDVPTYPSENITIARRKEDGDWVSYSMSPNAAYNRQIINAAVERIQE